MKPSPKKIANAHLAAQAGSPQSIIEAARDLARGRPEALSEILTDLGIYAKRQGHRQEAVWVERAAQAIAEAVFTEMYPDADERALPVDRYPKYASQSR
jgi:hypothetical protein